MKKFTCKLFYVLVGILLLLSQQSAFAAPPEGQITEGSLVLIGGGLRNNNAEIYSEMVKLAGGPGKARIAVVPLAAANPLVAGEAQVKVFQQYGADAFIVPIGNSKVLKNFETEVYNVELITKVKNATAVFFCGGTQQRIVGALYDKSGAKTPLLDAIWSVYLNGGVIAGTSAGAFIMSDPMLGADLDVLDMLKKGKCEDNIELFRGLGFLGPDVLIDLHFNTKGRFARLPVAMKSQNYKLGIGVDENTAIVVSKKNDVQVLGYSGVMIMDLSEAATDPEIAAFNMNNIRLTYLEKGDTFNLATKEVKVNSIKAKIDAQKPKNAGKIAYQDILGNTAVTDLMYNFIDCAEPEALGLAFSIRSDKKNNELGFKFIFKKDYKAEGYFTNYYGLSNYSIKNIYLDILPITMSASLYSEK